MLFLDTSLTPFVIIVPHGEVTVEDVAGLEQGLIEVFRAKRQLFVLVESRGSRWPSAVVRRRLSDMSNDVSPVTRPWTIGTVVVVSSSILAGALQAVNWLTRDDAVPMSCASAERAAPAIAQAFKEKSEPLPDDYIDLLRKLDTADADIGKLRELGVLPA